MENQKFNIPQKHSLESMEGVPEQDGVVNNKLESEISHKIDTSDRNVLKKIYLKKLWSDLGDNVVVVSHDSLGVIEWDKDKYSNHFYPKSKLPKGEDYTYRSDSFDSKDSFKTGQKIVLDDILDYVRDNKIKVLNASVLAYLLDNKQEIPDEWKDKRVLFLGTEFIGSYEIATVYRPKNGSRIGYARDKFGAPNGLTRYEINTRSIFALFYRDEVRHQSGKVIERVTEWDVEPVNTDKPIDLSRGDSIVYLA